jgi:hypothetical protein
VLDQLLVCLSRLQHLVLLNEALRVLEEGPSIEPSIRRHLCHLFQVPYYWPSLGAGRDCDHMSGTI